MRTLIDNLTDRAGEADALVPAQSPSRGLGAHPPAAVGLAAARAQLPLLQRPALS